MTTHREPDQQPHSFTGGAAGVPCPSCRKDFKPSSSQRKAIDAGRKAYCSRACQKAAHTETRNCAQCGKEITETISGHKFRGERAFCSIECKTKQPMKKRTRVTIPCARCGSDVERTPSAAANAEKTYCSRQCKHLDMVGERRVERPEKPCEVCATVMVMTPDMVSKGQRFCSIECSGKGRRRKPGERYIDDKGYAWITTPDGRSMLEHSYVMEQHLGRRLTSIETVHHKTGGFAGRSNNDLSNLEHWSGRHPKGHRIEDIVTYCREMLAVYGDEAERERYADRARVVLEGMVE